LPGGVGSTLTTLPQALLLRAWALHLPRATSDKKERVGNLKPVVFVSGWIKGEKRVGFWLLHLESSLFPTSRLRICADLSEVPLLQTSSSKKSVWNSSRNSVLFWLNAGFEALTGLHVVIWHCWVCFFDL
jgi:hypothetical protein